MGIFAIVLTLLTNVFVTSMEIQIESQSQSSVHQDGRYLLAKLMYDINQSDSIVAPTSLGQQSNTLQLTIDGASQSYAISNNRLALTNSLGTNYLTGPDTQISNLSFTRVGNVSGKNTIVINFVLTSLEQKKSGSESQSFETVVGVR